MKSAFSIIIESPSEQLFSKHYPQIITLFEDSEITYLHKRDAVTFGPGDDIVIAGLVFIYQSVMSGITWDIIKQTIEKLLSCITNEQRKKIYIYFENKQTKERIKISITDNNVDMIEIKDKLKIQFKK